MNFRDAINARIAELTPQPWDYTTPDGVTLTVIPAGLPADKGTAEVYLRVTASKTLAAEATIRTVDGAAILAALGSPIAGRWEHEPHWADGTPMHPVGHWLGDDTGLALSPADGGFVLEVRETTGAGIVTVSILLPEAQRLPLASALGRALDVARAWED
jgi:hypothetical protein